MAERYAKVIIDISHEKVDKAFDYRIPEPLLGRLPVGMQVEIPFGAGNTVRRGYVVELTDEASCDPARLKTVIGVVEGSVTAEAQLIKLAWWMKERYGSTMNQALKTVLPVKQKVKQKERRALRLLLSDEELEKAIEEAVRKKYRARARLLEAFREARVIPFETAAGQGNPSAATLKPLIEKGIIAVETKAVFRNPVKDTGRASSPLSLNQGQQAVVDAFCADYDAGRAKTYLIHGITGSGKTEVYMELIEKVQKDGRQVIVLIPEIALTYQTVMRFYSRFGDQVSIINSRLSAGERYDQFERARKGEISIMIGPRSALFTPFAALGLIIIDEEHESAYKSEVAPRYRAGEVAAKRAEMNHAGLVLGSATPSLESYTKALDGSYRLIRLNVRAKAESRLADVKIVDLRKELEEGNKSMFSRELMEKIEDRLSKKEQIMLFINRRGYHSFVSCRSCGEAVKCPHCDVTLTLHNHGGLVCHYCGYTSPMPARCPSCGSPYIAGFGTGTQKIEAMTKKLFPQARVLRMDADTTSKKGGHEEILSTFARAEADILIGTQMIVKGHDFPNVTLVGVLAADLSLYSPDYRCAERTFQLLCQAAGRAGRDGKRGAVVIQTYNPEHYSIVTSAAQDYEAFYTQEMAYRRMMRYPPACQMMEAVLSSPSEDALCSAMDQFALAAQMAAGGEDVQMIGPVDAPVYKVNDIYRKILYMKHENYDILIKIRKQTEDFMEREDEAFKNILVQYDFS